MPISASIIADSINPKGCRLTTFVLRFPRIVLAEFNTHRAFSRNSASSRAIPFEKMLEMVKNDPFIPLRFQKDHKGMQGVDYFEGAEWNICVEDWLKARDLAIEAATSFELPVTKQLRNRLLEPFMWHTVIVTATDYENFFALRAHKDAELHIEKLAYLMLEEYNKSVPKKLSSGEWHLPFGDKIDDYRLFDAMNTIYPDYASGLSACPYPQYAGGILGFHLFGQNMDGVRIIDRLLEDPKNSFGDHMFSETRRKIAVARCCRISYGNFEGKDDYVADIKLCDRLFGATPKHLSPTEHVARCEDHNNFIGNFKGFTQFRKTFSDENLTDSRVKK